MFRGATARISEARFAFESNARDRNLRRAQLSFATAWAGEWTFTVVLGVVAFRDGGAGAVGLVALLRMLPAALLSPVGTALADRFRRERILVWVGAVRAGAVGAAALVLAGDGPLVIVYALAVVATVDRPAHSALLPSLCLRPEELTSANVVRGLLDSGSTLLGPLIAAVLLDVASPATALVAVAIMSLVSAVSVGAIRYESPPRAAPASPRYLLAETAAGFGVLARHSEVRLICALTLVQTFTRGTFTVFSVVVAIELLETGEPGVGLLSAAVGAGAVVGSLAASLLVGARRLAGWFGLGVALWGLPLSLIGVFPHEVVAVALLGAVGVGNALVDVGLFTLPGRLVPDEYLARVFGAMESLIAVSVGLGAIVTPPLIALLDVQTALVVLGALAPVAALLAARALGRLDAEMVTHDQEIDLLRRVEMFRPLSVPAIEQLARGLRRTGATEGKIIIHEGDRGDRFYVVARGEAEVLRGGQRIEAVGAGGYFGEIALLRDVPRTATVRACTHVVLYALERDRFLAAVGGYRASTEEADAVVRERTAAIDLGKLGT
jgi:MFS family permease